MAKKTVSQRKQRKSNKASPKALRKNQAKPMTESRDGSFPIPSDLKHALWKDYSDISEKLPEGRKQYALGRSLTFDSGTYYLRFLNEALEGPKALHIMHLAAAKAHCSFGRDLASRGYCWPWMFRMTDEGLLDYVVGQTKSTRENLLAFLQWVWTEPQSRPTDYTWLFRYMSKSYIDTIRIQLHEVHPRIRSCLLSLSRGATAALLGVPSHLDNWGGVHWPGLRPWETAEKRADEKNRSPDVVDYLIANLEHLAKNGDVVTADVFGARKDADQIHSLAFAAFKHPDMLIDDAHNEVVSAAVTTIRGSVVDVARREQCRELFGKVRDDWTFLATRSILANVCGFDPHVTPIRRFLDHPCADSVQEALNWAVWLDSRLSHDLRTTALSSESKGETDPSQLGDEVILQAPRSADTFSAGELSYDNPPSEGAARTERVGGSTAPRRPKLNAMEQNVLDAIREGGRMTTEPLAKKAGYRISSTFKQTLAGMVRRGILANKSDDRGRGYELHPEFDPLSTDNSTD